MEIGCVCVCVCVCVSLSVEVDKVTGSSEVSLYLTDSLECPVGGLTRHLLNSHRILQGFTSPATALS